MKAIMICKDRKIRIFPIEGDNFEYNDGVYEIDEKKQYFYKRDVALIYREGVSEPLQFDDVKNYGITAEDIKKFASKHLLNTIVRLMDKEDPIFIIVIINLILTIVGIITNIWW